MTTLHLLSIGCFEQHTVQRCFATVQAGDGLLLLSEGVNLLRQSARLRAQLAQLEQQLRAPISCYALDVDVAARAIASTQEGVVVIDAQRWVQLTLAYQRSMSWQ